MRVLQINDMAGVAGVLTKYLRKAGHEATNISFMDDDFGFIDFYQGTHFQDKKIMMAVLQGMIPQYDILHVHFSYHMLPWLYKFGKPIVYHAHGTEIATQTMEVRLAAQQCKAIVVANTQTVKDHPRAQHLPIPVDTEHFKPIPELRKYGYMMFDIPYLDTAEAFNESGVHPIIVNREKNFIPYSEMPKFLNQFEGYVDYRWHKQRGYLEDMSTTGLQSLACGLKVYHDGQWKEGFPEAHKPENVIVNLIKIYEEVLAI